MPTWARLTAFATAVAVVFAGAWGLGAVAGPALAEPTVTAVAPEGPADGHAAGSESGGADDHAAGSESGGADEGSDGAAGHGSDGHTHGGEDLTGTDGLAAEHDGYRFAPLATTLPAGPPATLAFRITDPAGAPVTAFTEKHERLLHLIVVRRDGTGFQHLHPTLGADGTWQVPLTLPTGGVYRALADFHVTGGPELTLGTDLFAPGDFAPAAPVPTRDAAVDGYAVRLEGDLVAGRAGEVVATVTRDGRPVTDLQPYLGALGHLVALRGSDLAYLHVHPHDTPGAGPQVRFTVEVPTSGTYRMFLDFQHDGTVRTADFTVEAAR